MPNCIQFPSDLTNPSTRGAARVRRANKVISKRHQFICSVAFWPKQTRQKYASNVAIGGKADIAYCTAYVR